MKTLAEFIQRLQEDAAFEKQAQSFDHADDLMAFVKRKGYDFTLEQLMREFESGEKPRAETGGPAPVRTSPPPRPDRADFPGQPEAFFGPKKGAGLLTKSGPDVIRETPVERVPQPQAAMTPPGSEEGPRAGLFKSGGGRHRGFCPQRLKPISEEES